MATAASPERRILLVDADAFFVAVARLEDPEGAGQAKLLVVGGAPGSRGVVCSASYEARRYGVRSAMSIAQAQRLCPGAMFVPVPGAACGRKSREISKVLARLSPIVEQASIDEWYLDLTGTDALYRGLTFAQVAHRIRDAVRAEAGLSISLGGGTNKLIAKLAVEHAKPRPGTSADGVFCVPPGGEQEFLLRLELGDIPLVGPRFRERLAEFGLVRVPDVIRLGLPELVRMIGERAAGWLWDRVHGVHRGVVEHRDRPRGISREETFSRDLTSDASLEGELLRLVVRAARDLRGRGLEARTISVKLRDADFRTRRASRTLPEPVIADRVIFDVARELLAKLRRARRAPSRLIGVALTNLEDAHDRQLALFDSWTGDESQRDRKLAETVDRVRQRFGVDAVVPARLTDRRESHRESPSARKREEPGASTKRRSPAT
jgi:DNA polymerase IV